MKRTEQKRRIAKLALAGGFLFGCFVVADLAIIMAGENLELINPDFLYGIEFLRDLRTSGSDWFWITPPSAYWFPDLVVRGIKSSRGDSCSPLTGSSSSASSRA